MGIKLIVQVLLHAPIELTAAERMILVAIAENVRDGDPRRLTWPDFNAAVLAERSGLTGKGSLKDALQRLAKRGLEVRVPLGVGKDGRPFYAVPGKQCRYRFPVLEGGNWFPPSEEEEGGNQFPAGEVTASPQGEVTASPGEITASPQDSEGRAHPRQERSQPPPTPAPPTTPPSPSSASADSPSTPAPSDGAGGGGEQQQDEKQLAAAIAFLTALPAPWAAGRVTARAVAPLLLDSITAQGWELNHALVAKLTENPGGINSYSRVLRTRIADLPKRSTNHQAAPAAALPSWCGHCGDGIRAAADNAHLRLIEDEHGNRRPCPDCNPNAQRTP